MRTPAEDSVVQIPLKRLVVQCFHCRHWDGDKEKVQQVYDHNAVSMDMFKGWPEEGRCLIDYEWATIDVNGNATAELTVPANFGCPFGAV